MRTRFALALVAALALALPASASALSFRIVNESGRPAEDVYVTIDGTDFDVPGVGDDVPVKLSELPDPLTINTIESGRIYVSYGAPVTVSESFTSPTRFDWAELTVKPNSADVANLTAVDQFAIGMRLDTYDAAGAHLEEVTAANSDTIFAALQAIPGGSQATVKNGSGEIVRVLSPKQRPDLYPDLGEYVRSMAGQTVTLHTGLFFTPFATSEYTGTFAADGSITLHGSTYPLGKAPEEITFTGPELIEDIYTGANTPNDGEGAIRRDLLAAFSTGFWGGKYGNDALAFCTDPQTNEHGRWCPNGFNQPAFAAARASVSPFPTYEEYAAVIARYANEYGNPYSDASGKVTVGLDQPVTGGDVSTLQLTILPDSPPPAAVPAAPPAPGAPGAVPIRVARPSHPTAVARFKLAKKTHLGGGKLRVGKVSCAKACGTVRALVRKGHKAIARAKLKLRAKSGSLVLGLTKPGRQILAHGHKLKARLDVWVSPAGRKTAHARRMLLILPAAH